MDIYETTEITDPSTIERLDSDGGACITYYDPYEIMTFYWNGGETVQVSKEAGEKILFEFKIPTIPASGPVKMLEAFREHCENWILMLGADE